ncbi:MAG: septal ring lytic transglycosylase RlpA family protein [Xanthobacteraceae bacterium]
MCRWRIIGAAWAVAAFVCSLSNRAPAETFEERWSPVPKAHAEPGPPPPPSPPSSTNGAQRAPQWHAGATASHARPRKPLFVGRASFYSYRGGKTASGLSFNAHGLTAAHRTLPFGTRVRVTDIKTQKSVEVTITDRGPAARSRVLDLSLGAAKVLGIGNRGVIQVRAERLSG